MRAHHLAGCLGLLSVLLPPLLALGAEPTPLEVLHLDSPEADPRQRLVYAVSMQDDARLHELLESRELPRAVRAWHLARRAAKAGELEEAWKRAREARDHWSDRDNVLAALAPWFDRFELALALDQGRQKEAAKLLQSPLAEHREDALWWSLRARWLLGAGDLSNAVLRFDRAWAIAGASERGDPAFGVRALAHLRAGDPNSAAEAWMEYLESLNWARDKAAALALWDAHGDLRDALERSHRRTELASWLSRNARREEALGVALRAWHEGSEGEAREGYLLAAEQLYRLRRHEELDELLQERPPRYLDREERAALDAYPWGVQRRSGASEEIARGFDRVVEEYAGTARAVEALWEAAWMWELSGRVDEAESRYLRYAEEHPRAPFARAAALRALYLPFRAERHEQLLARMPALRPGLGHAAEEAAALWLASRSADALGRGDEADTWVEELANSHQDSPFLGSIPNPLQMWKGSVDPEALFERQRLAYERLAQELGVSGLFDPQDPELAAAQLLLAWGFFDEGERILEERARSARRDPELQLRCAALAWAAGRAERQARIGWWLRAVLGDRSEELDADLDACFFPTPYVQSVAEGGRRTGIAPGLLWGLMRRESFYEADVISQANAYGLLQLLPRTGRQMAERLGEGGFEDPRSLLDPGRNLRYGGEYLAQLLQETRGDIFQALAAYNAGESNGRRWKERLDGGAPAEELILLISYSETRAYVYHVLRHWKLYGRIHPSLAP